MIDRELRDELEVPGHVVMHKAYSKQEAITRCREIISEWESLGYKKPNDAPEGALKDEFRQLMKGLGVNFTG